MVIYCAKCESANSDLAPFCGECGHVLTALAPAAPKAESGDAQPDDRTLNAEPVDTPRPWTATLFARFIYGLMQVCVALWALGLGGIGCLSLIPGPSEEFAGGGSYLVAALLVALMFHLRDLTAIICRHVDSIKGEQ